jgi:hypothetical protein
MTLSTLENNLQSWLAGIVAPLIVILKNQNAPRPTGDFMAYGLSKFSLVGLSGAKSKPTTNGVVTITSNLEFTASISGYGATGVTGLHKVFTAQQVPRYLKDLRAKGFAWVDSSPVFNLPKLLNEHSFESQGAIDVTFRAVNKETYTDYLISQYGLELEVYKGQNKIFDQVI